MSVFVPCAKMTEPADNEAWGNKHIGRIKVPIISSDSTDLQSTAEKVSLLTSTRDICMTKETRRFSETWDYKMNLHVRCLKIKITHLISSNLIAFAFTKASGNVIKSLCMSMLWLTDCWLLNSAESQEMRQNRTRHELLNSNYLGPMQAACDNYLEAVNHRWPLI